MNIDSLFFILRAGIMTIVVSIISFICGLALSIIIAYFSMSKIKLLNVVSWLYLQIMRGTPLLMQVFFIFFALPQFGIQLSILSSALVALIANTGAFMSEIVRSSVESVHRGQWDAANSLALSRLQIMTQVIMPQAVRIAIPPTIGYITSLIKNTSVASTIGLLEATRAGRLVTEQTGQGLVVFFSVGVLYFVICYPVSKLSKRIEKRYQT